MHFRRDGELFTHVRQFAVRGIKLSITWIERHLSQELVKIAASFPVTVVTGPRQVGKTSLLEKTFPEYAYVSMDVKSHAEMAETRPEAFLEKYPPPIILDEIQYAPAFFRQIKTFVDSHRGQYGLFLLSGSQNFMLMKNVADSLAGRAAVIPFSGLSGESGLMPTKRPPGTGEISSGEVGILAFGIHQMLPY